MEYNAKKVKEELTEMGFMKEGLIAFGQTQMGSAWGALGAIIAKAVSDYFAIVKLNDKIMVIPYDSDKIDYDKAQSFEKENIVKAKVTIGMFTYRKLKIWTKDGKCHKFYITKGRDEVKAMINLLDVNKKK